MQFTFKTNCTVSYSYISYIFILVSLRKTLTGYPNSSYLIVSFPPPPFTVSFPLSGMKWLSTVDPLIISEN